MADRLGWVPDEEGWRCGGQWFSWDEAALQAKWHSAQVLYAKVASTRADFEGLAASFSIASFRQLKLNGQSQKEDRKSAPNAALGAFQVGDFCVKCGEAVENLEHIVHHCPHWRKKRCESGLPAWRSKLRH
eukprot:3498153-Amphidinium_carterae.1